MPEPAHDRKKLIEGVLKRWKRPNCPLCDKTSWTVPEDLFELRQLSLDGFHVGGPRMPVVPVICEHCGNTVLVNAIVAGVVPPKTAKKGQGE